MGKTTLSGTRKATAFLAAVLTLGGAGLVACSSGEKPVAMRPAQATVPGVTVKLLGEGAAPRTPLVWFSDPGDQEVNIKTTEGMSQTTTGGKKNQRQDAASQAAGNSDATDDQGDLSYEEVTMNLPVKASSSTDGNKHNVTVTVGKPTGTNADRNEDISTAEGFEISSTSTADGRVSSRTLSAPETATDSARASIEHALTQVTDMPIVFPEQAIGEGATWSVSSRIDGVISMRQTVTYTLVERKGQAVRLRVAVDRAPAVKNLAQTDLNVLDSTTQASGQLNLDLTKPLPVRGRVEIKQTLTFGKQGSKVKVNQETVQRTEWDS